MTVQTSTDLVQCKLTHMADVFTSLCVISIFKSMNEERRTLLVNGGGDFDPDDCYGKGMELLRIASQSGQLGARYISTLDQLNEQLRIHKPSNRDKNTGYTPIHTNDGQNVVSENRDSETGGLDWQAFEADNLEGLWLDFAGIEDLFVDMDPWTDLNGSYAGYNEGL